MSRNDRRGGRPRHSNRVRDQHWMIQGACVGTDTDAFFPKNNERDSKWPAKRRFAQRICAHCPVQAICRAWAIENDERGIWGGTDTTMRRKMQEVAAV